VPAALTAGDHGFALRDMAAFDPSALPDYRCVWGAGNAPVGPSVASLTPVGS